MGALPVCDVEVVYSVLGIDPARPELLRTLLALGPTTVEAAAEAAGLPDGAALQRDVDQLVAAGLVRETTHAGERLFTADATAIEAMFHSLWRHIDRFGI